MLTAIMPVSYTHTHTHTHTQTHTACPKTGTDATCGAHQSPLSWKQPLCNYITVTLVLLKDACIQSDLAIQTNSFQTAVRRSRCQRRDGGRKQRYFYSKGILLWNSMVLLLQIPINMDSPRPLTTHAQVNSIVAL